MAILITLALVAMSAVTYGYPKWGGYYLFAGFWTLIFLSLTPLIIKAMMFDRRPGRGLLLIGLKLAWLVVIFLTLNHWSRREPGGLTLGTALVAGVITPLLVVVLRVLGGALAPQSDATKPIMKGKP